MSKRQKMVSTLFPDLPYFSSPDLDDALPAVLSFTREKQEASSESSFLVQVVLSAYTLPFPPPLPFLSLFPFISSSHEELLSPSLFLSHINIPTTELSTSTVYLLLAMHLGKLIRSRSSRPGEIGRKAHLPRSFIPILRRVNSRNREE